MTILSDPASEAVIEEVADREGVDPIELEEPLYEAIDPDALDAAVRSATDGDAGLRIEFTYCGYDVTVESSGTVRVTEATSSSSDSSDFQV